MVEKRFFIDGSKLQYHQGIVRRWQEGQQIYPIHVEISPSSGCNQRCILCCVNYKNHDRKDLSNELMLRLPEDFKETGTRSFLLAGEGEPLLNKSCVGMLQRSKALGIDGALTTNGALFDPKTSEESMYALSWVRFSIQSFDPENYRRIHQVSTQQYNTTMGNIAHAVQVKRKQGLETKIGIQQILLEENWSEIAENARRAKELGVDYWTIKRFSKHPENKYDVPEDIHKKCVEQFQEAEQLSDAGFKAIIRWNQFESQPRTYDRCIGLPFITQILADGGVYPCCQFFDNPNMSYGNLYDASFKAIMESEKARKTIKGIEKNYDVNANHCMSYCRHHSTNLFLYDVLGGKINLNEEPGESPEHVNFI